MILAARQSPQLIRPTAIFLDVITRGFRSYFETDLIPVFETVRHGLRRTENPYLELVHDVIFDTLQERISGHMHVAHRKRRLGCPS
jgi:hypothetical protein